MRPVLLSISALQTVLPTLPLADVRAKFGLAVNPVLDPVQVGKATIAPLIRFPQLRGRLLQLGIQTPPFPLRLRGIFLNSP